MRGLSASEMGCVAGGWDSTEDPLHPDLGLPGQGTSFGGQDNHSEGPHSPSGAAALDAAVTTLGGAAYGALCAAAGLEEAPAVIATATVTFLVHELPELPPPAEGGAFYVHKQ